MDILFSLNSTKNIGGHQLQVHLEEVQGLNGEDVGVEIVICNSYFQIVIHMKAIYAIDLVVI